MTTPQLQQKCPELNLLYLLLLVIVFFTLHLAGLHQCVKLKGTIYFSFFTRKEVKEGSCKMNETEVNRTVFTVAQQKITVTNTTHTHTRNILNIVLLLTYKNDFALEVCYRKLQITWLN